MTKQITKEKAKQTLFLPAHGESEVPGKNLRYRFLREAVVWCEKLLLLFSIFGSFIMKDDTYKIIHKDVCNKDHTENIPDGASQC